MTIKKDFVELVELLEGNKNKKVQDIMSLVLEIATSNRKPKTFQVDDEGNITHIFCYYHKEWEPVEWYGKKASSHTGFNTMCKQGVNQWTKQQTELKKFESDLLAQVQSGEIEYTQIEELREQAKENAKRIEQRVE